MPDICVKIAIPGSTSRTYAEVIRRAKKTGFFDDSENKLVVNGITNLFSIWPDFTFILFTAQKWTGFYMSVNNSPVMPYTNDCYYLLQEIMYCSASRSSAQEGAQYCRSNCWGCQKITSINRYISTQNHYAPPWYKYGSFVNSETWRVHKIDIINTLFLERDLKMLNFCQYWDDKAIKETVSKLPDQFYIGDNFDILYNVDYSPDGNPVYLPTGIQHHAQFEGYVKTVTTAKPPENPDINDIDQVNDYLDKMLKRRKSK